MPATSRNANRKRKARRNITLLKRAVQQESTERYKTHVFLITLLAELGGEVVLKPETVQKVVRNLQNLGWEIVPNADGEGSTIRITTRTEADGAPTPAVDQAASEEVGVQAVEQATEGAVV